SAIALMLASGSNGLDVRVDPRVELLTIVFRLAGAGEFQMSSGESPYSKRVDQYFAKFKNHPAVVRAAHIRDEYGIGFDAVPVLAVHLKDVRGFKELVSFDSPPARWDERWKPAVARSFVGDLKKFVKDTRFEGFLKSEEPYYAKATLGLKSLAVKFPVDQWMTDFYGVPPDRKPYAIIGLLCGGGNYGMSVEFPDGKVQISPVLGADTFDKDGVPIFGETSVPLLVHEFSHAYVNHLVEPFVKELSPSVSKYEPILKGAWAAGAYEGPKTILCESFVRTVEHYLSQKYLSEGTAVANLIEQRSAGFLWTTDLSDMLDGYEKSRAKYKTFRDYLPQLLKRFELLAQTPQALYDRCPKITKFETTFGPIQGENRLLTIHVEFDQPMMTNTRGLSMEPPGWEVQTKTTFASDSKSFDIILRVRSSVDYLLSLNRFGRGLMSEKRYPLLPYQHSIKADGSSN
ncbi:MAG: DUF4932 domain-containing protein, partial [Fimbriimonadaceae bacterium]